MPEPSEVFQKSNHSTSEVLKNKDETKEDDEKALKDAIMHITRNPTCDEAYFKAGYLLLQFGKIRASIRSFVQCLKLNSSNCQCKAYLSLPLLLMGDYDAGLHLYEWRLTVKQLLYCTPAKKLKPRESQFSKDETIALVAEQGFGDTIQFIRYGKHLAQNGVKVIACVQTQLVGLLKHSLPGIGFVAADEINTVKYEAWLPMLSLPLRLGVNQSNVLETEPYILAEKERKDYWMKKIAADGERLVAGICWKGNPDHEKTIIRGRSMRLVDLIYVVRNSLTHKFVSLQKGEDAIRELERFGHEDKFVECQREVSNSLDFRDTAAIISCCDVVITIDTCIAHLAGSMGVPVWILLKKIPEWRWGLEGNQSHWYPSATLFRQQTDGDWTSIIPQITTNLNARKPS